MQRKAALIGCREGQWIRTSGMRGLHVNIRVHRDSIVKVEQAFDESGEETHVSIFTGAGVRPVRDALWTRVCVVDGQYQDALCLLEARQVA